MSDLVKRLRTYALESTFGGLMERSAKEIEHLQARVAELGKETERLSNVLAWEKRCHKVASEKLVPVESDRSSLRKALDDRYEADKKAAKAIFQATGRKWGFPDNKEVVAYYVAENERLEKALSYSTDCFNECAANEDTLRAENRTLREALERIKNLEYGGENFRNDAIRAYRIAEAALSATAPVQLNTPAKE